MAAIYLSNSSNSDIAFNIAAFVMLKYGPKFGRSIYTVGGNEQSALMLGLNVRKVKLKAYILDGFFVARCRKYIVLLKYARRLCKSKPKGFEMDAIASSVIGGTLLTRWCRKCYRYIICVVLIKATIEAFITFKERFSSWWTRITIAALLCFFIVLQSILSADENKKQ